MKDWNPAVPARFLLLKKAHVQARLKFANDSEENWVKVLWSDVTKIQLFGINSNRRVWRRWNAAYNSMNTIPTVNHGGGNNMLWCVFLLRGQDNCTASKGRWMGPCTVSARALEMGRLLALLHCMIRFGTARYGTVRLSSGRFAFPPQFSTAIEWAGLFTRRYNCAASTAVRSS